MNRCVGVCMTIQTLVNTVLPRSVAWCGVALSVTGEGVYAGQDYGDGRLW